MNNKFTLPRHNGVVNSNNAKKLERLPVRDDKNVTLPSGTIINYSTTTVPQYVLDKIVDDTTDTLNNMIEKLSDNTKTHLSDTQPVETNDGTIWFKTEE